MLGWFSFLPYLSGSFFPPFLLFSSLYVCLCQNHITRFFLKNSSKTSCLLFAAVIPLILSLIPVLSGSISPEFFFVSYLSYFLYFYKFRRISTDRSPTAAKVGRSSLTFPCLPRTHFDSDLEAFLFSAHYQSSFTF